MKKLPSYMFLLSQGKNIFKKELIYKGRYDILFCYLPVQFVSRNTIFFSTVRHSFLKELVIAKTAKYSESLIFTNLEIELFCAVQETSRMF